MGGLGALKSAFDLAKTLKDISDATARNSVVIELQEKILAAREAQSALLDRVSTLEKEVTEFKTWEAEKQRYELKQPGTAFFAYMLKPNARGTEPAHWACTSCFSNKKISIIQMGTAKNQGDRLMCPACKAEARPDGSKVDYYGGPIWLD